MSDITRLLFLLNKKPENVEMPPDGMQLLEWSEQTLNHYLESQVRLHTLQLLLYSTAHRWLVLMCHETCTHIVIDECTMWPILF